MVTHIKKNRPAIAMIELIFALVIMGIVLMSAPQLISTATNSGYVAIQQEAINEAATHMNQVLGYQWDENDVNASFIAPILRVNNGDSELDMNATTYRRDGMPWTASRSFKRSDGAVLWASSTIGWDSGESTKGDEDDMDDFNGETYNLHLVESSTADYIEKQTDINIATSVVYGNDNAIYQTKSLTFNFPTNATPTTAVTNIKKITVTLTSTSGMEELNKTIVLKAFSCNIGEQHLEERYP